MKLIKAFETPDKKRFFVEQEARDHERRYDYGNLISDAVIWNPEVVKLDREILTAFLMRYGSTIGKLADSPILPREDSKTVNVMGTMTAEQAARMKATMAAESASPRGVLRPGQPVENIDPPANLKKKAYDSNGDALYLGDAVSPKAGVVWAGQGGTISAINEHGLIYINSWPTPLNPNHFVKAVPPARPGLKDRVVPTEADLGSLDEEMEKALRGL